MNLILSGLLIFLVSLNNICFAQTPKASPTKATDNCTCIQPAVDAIQKAYNALEEDEWTQAEKTTSTAINTIKTLANTCKCPEIPAYQKIASAFLKYAQGGNHLDGADEPNCPYALKLYSEAITELKESIPNISNQSAKSNASNIQEYADEELQFVKDECEDAKPTEPAKPAKKS